MTDSRANNYDLLRIISAAAVVIIHINLEYYPIGYGRAVKTGKIALDVFTRFCVPCFLMISGAFILNNEKNADYRYFYKKVFFKTILPFAAVAAFYFVYDIGRAVLTNSDIKPILLLYAKGREYNLWFMYFLIGIYLLAPLFVRIKKALNVPTYAVGVALWTAAAIVLMNLGKYEFAYSPVMIFSYMSFFLIGSLLYGRFKNKKYCGLYFFAAIVCFTVKFMARSLNIEMPLNNAVYFFPLTIAASVFVFLFFGTIKINCPLKKQADRTFYIYLFHTFIMYAIRNIFGLFIIGNSLITVILFSAFLFAASYLAAALCIQIKETVKVKIWKK